jgi:hypothetical protein
MNQYSEENPFKVNPYKSKGYTIASDIIAPLLGLAEVIGTKGQSKGDFSIGLSKNIRQQAADYENQAGSWEEQQQKARQAALERELKAKQQAREEERFGWEKNKQVAEQNYMAELSNAMTLKDPLERAKKNAEIEARYGRRPLEIPKAKEEEGYPTIPKGLKFSNPAMQALYDQALKGDKESQKLMWKNIDLKEPVVKNINEANKNQETTDNIMTAFDDLKTQYDLVRKNTVLGAGAGKGWVNEKFNYNSEDVAGFQTAKQILVSHYVKYFQGSRPSDFDFKIWLAALPSLNDNPERFQRRIEIARGMFEDNIQKYNELIANGHTPEEARIRLGINKEGNTQSQQSGFQIGKTYKDANGNTATYGGKDKTGKDVWK